MEKIKFIKDGENRDYGRFKTGDKDEVSEKLAQILVDRDGVAEREIKKEFKNKKEKIDGGE